MVVFHDVEGTHEGNGMRWMGSGTGLETDQRALAAVGPEPRSASRLATRLELLRNTLRPTPHVPLAMNGMISLPNSSMSTRSEASRTAPPTGSSSERPSEVRSAKRQ